MNKFDVVNRIIDAGANGYDGCYDDDGGPLCEYCPLYNTGAFDCDQSINPMEAAKAWLVNYNLDNTEVKPDVIKRTVLIEFDNSVYTEDSIDCVSIDDVDNRINDLIKQIDQLTEQRLGYQSKMKQWSRFKLGGSFN